MPGESPTRCVLTIAGSDSGGGAGIAADLKAFASCGVHGMAAVTAITAQNTVGVTAVAAIEPDIIVAQVAAVVDDIGVDAVKIGMLGSAATIAAVGRALDLLAPATPIVLDPVLVAESGASLLDDDARDALISNLIPRATVVTPNVPEACALTHADRRAGVEDLARAVHALGSGVVVVTGGHRESATDVVFDGRELTEITGPRHPDGCAHGSGCTHSSALAAHLAHGQDVLTAARYARQVAGDAVRDGLRSVGEGPGPVDVLRIVGRARR